MKRLNDTIGRVLGAMILLALVTAAHYAFQFIRSDFPEALLLVYCVTLVLLALGGQFILRRYAQRSYRNHHQLTNAALFLLSANWGLFFAFPSLYGPYNWAWSLSAEVVVPNPLRIVGLVLILAGLAGIVGSILWLGIATSTGQKSHTLVTDGAYRFSRNPQFVAGGFIVLGYVMLRPTGYALGWMLLFCVLAHQMVLSEEEHLSTTFSIAYHDYCRRTARYITRH